MKWASEAKFFWAALAVGYLGLAIASFVASAACKRAAQDWPRGLSGSQNVGLRLTVKGEDAKAEEAGAPTSGAFEDLANYLNWMGWITSVGFGLAFLAAGREYFRASRA